MAQQTKKKRKRKHRGTQGGSVSRRPGGRPKNREQARAQARKSATDRRDMHPTWQGAINRGLFGGAIFFVLTLILFKRPAAESLAFAAAMVVLYVPMGYYLDRFFYRRRQAKLRREREERRSQSQGR